LTGRVDSPERVAKYFEIAGPQLTRAAAMVGAELPARTQIRLPSLIASKHLAAQLGAGATRSARTITLTRDFSLIPSTPRKEPSSSGATTTITK
jgi:hypothetical protein